MVVGRAGFEPAKLKNNRFTVCPRWPLEYLPYLNDFKPYINYKIYSFSFLKIRADGGTRTHDLLITNQLL